MEKKLRSRPKNYHSRSLFPQDDFVNGDLSLFGWDLSEDLCSGQHHHTPLEGSLSLDLEFGTPLERNVTIVVYSSLKQAIVIPGSGYEHQSVAI